jgi:hypothetical protein
MASTFNINGVAVAAPKDFKVSIMDLDSEDAKRNANGTLMRDRVAVKRKIECSWGPLSNSEIKDILVAVSNTSVSVNFPDPLVGGQNTLNMYVGDRVAAALDFNIGKWLGLSFSLTEL